MARWRPLKPPLLQQQCNEHGHFPRRPFPLSPPRERKERPRGDDGGERALPGHFPSFSAAGTGGAQPTGERRPRVQQTRGSPSGPAMPTDRRGANPSSEARGSAGVGSVD